MQRLYSAAPDGYCGDEDNGQTSAWYVFSALGFYPVCPASTQYALGVPLFRRAVVTRGDGTTLTIDAPENSPGTPYVHEVTLNGRNWTRNYLDHGDLVAGARLEFTLDSLPGYDRGRSPEDCPGSFSR